MKDLKEVVKVGISLANALGSAMEDGKVDFTDIAAFWPVATELPKAIDGIENAIKQFQELDDTQMQELKSYFVQNFDIPQDNVELMVEGALEVVSSIFKVYVLSKVEASKAKFPQAIKHGQAK